MDNKFKYQTYDHKTALRYNLIFDIILFLSYKISSQSMMTLSQFATEAFAIAIRRKNSYFPLC